MHHEKVGKRREEKDGLKEKIHRGRIFRGARVRKKSKRESRRWQNGDGEWSRSTTLSSCKQLGTASTSMVMMYARDTVVMRTDRRDMT
ncbi:hypothetical protein HYALB_00010558 [Hymenoscyphus albidus]|uniref:Uncharacterized protein n=1 Tax=Hymenoscyphus albidus TaxID=595503 RepID=A0A9N9Q0S6_9HELO|nr:hypothetical protein HYALB_00010558 [Hymenoscyphus albidus]